MKKVLILGVNGFIGHHLSKRILETTDWDVYGMDMQNDRLGDLINHPRMHFFEGDITINKEWVEYHIRKCDVILPLVAIATPATYVQQPLKVFELDFEANLPIVRSAVKYKKHLVFPSTSEVYGMCEDSEFDPSASSMVYGPINKPRWIYACSKQLMDRVIWGYGMEGLRFTLFRPFNWIGPGLDSIYTPKEGSSRVVTQFLGHIVRGEPINLVDGGAQKRAFTYVDDGIESVACGVTTLTWSASCTGIQLTVNPTLLLIANPPAWNSPMPVIILIPMSAARYGSFLEFRPLRIASIESRFNVGL